MSDLFIDISAGSCLASCHHCKYGIKEIQGPVSFPDPLINTYQQLLVYANATNAKVRVSFMNNALHLPPLSFLGGVHTLSLAFNNLIELTSSSSAYEIISICRKIPPLSILELHVNKLEMLDHENEVEILKKVIMLQLTLLQQFPNILIHVGMNDNTTNELLSITQNRILPMFILYQEMIRLIDDLLLDETRIEISRRTPLLTLNCEVLFMDGKAISFGARYIDATIVADEARPWGYSLQDNDAPMVIALFPWGVHLDHSTFNINDNRLKFSHRDFIKLLDKVMYSNTPLKKVCLEAVQRKKCAVSTVRV
jgi:hypothetical protein